MVELYDKNNTAHNNRNIYEVVEWEKVVDSRHPDSVEVGTLEEDMARRDFTTGNIYWSPRELIIAVQSVDDILDRKLRFVGNPEERLHEDLLRGWRFMRLAKTKNLTPDKDSLRAVRRNWENIYNTSNPHRVMLELEKLCLK
jgi:poly(A) polymerase